MKRGPYYSRGAAMLADWLAKKGVTHRSLAEKLGIARAGVSQWLTGRTRPKPGLRERLQQETRIPFDAWYTAAETKAFARRPAA